MENVCKIAIIVQTTHACLKPSFADLENGVEILRKSKHFTGVIGYSNAFCCLVPDVLKNEPSIMKKQRRFFRLFRKKLPNLLCYGVLHNQKKLPTRFDCNV